MMDAVAKYLSGNANLDEQKQVEEWRDGNPEEFLALSEAWSFSGTANFDAQEAKKAVLSRISNQKRFDSGGTSPSKRSHWIWVAAACVLVLVGVGYFAYVDSDASESVLNPTGWEVVETGSNETKEVKLSDGSIVSLSGESVLSYPSSFDSERKVTLSGRAFFDVVPNASLPFKVETFEAVVTVLGTSFQVKTAEEARYSEVIVETGKVSLTKKPQANVAERAVKIDLSPGEVGIVKRESKGVSKAKNNNQNYLAWKTNKIVFDKTSLRDVAATLHDVYKVDVQFSSNSIANCRLTATFEKKPIEEVMEVISQTFGYEITNRKANYLITGNSCN